MQGRPPTEGFLSPAGGDRSRYDPLQGRALGLAPAPCTSSRVHVFPRCRENSAFSVLPRAHLQAPEPHHHSPQALPPLALWTASSSYFSPVFFLPA